jgi:hypothetical protein
VILQLESRLVLYILFHPFSVTVIVANAVSTSVMTTTLDTFNEAPVLRTKEENIILLLFVVLALQHTTMVTGELVLLFNGSSQIAT